MFSVAGKGEGDCPMISNLIHYAIKGVWLKFNLHCQQSNRAHTLITKHIVPVIPGFLLSQQTGVDEDFVEILFCFHDKGMQLWSCLLGSAPEDLLSWCPDHVKLTERLYGTLQWQDRQGRQGLSGLCTAPALQSSPEGQKCHHIHHSCSRTAHTVAMVICQFFSLLCLAKQWWVGAEIQEKTKRIVCPVLCVFQCVCM